MSISDPVEGADNLVAGCGVNHTHDTSAEKFQFQSQPLTIFKRGLEGQHLDSCRMRCLYSDTCYTYPSYFIDGTTCGKNGMCQGGICREATISKTASITSSTISAKPPLLPKDGTQKINTLMPLWITIIILSIPCLIYACYRYKNREIPSPPVPPKDKTPVPPPRSKRVVQVEQF